jgi:uncharacterized protein
MKVLVTGGTGFVGRTVVRALAQGGAEVTVLTRSEAALDGFPDGVSRVQGDPTSAGTWQEEAARCDAVINLAGASIFGRWTDSRKTLLRESRILTTHHVVEALSARNGKETVLLSTSATGYYGFTGHEELEESAPPGTDFLATLAADWEKEALAAETYGVRVAICRFGLVLGRGGGSLKQMLPLFRLGLGSQLGSGNQWFPWIHEADLARALVFLLERRDLSGLFNCTAPHPVRNQEFTQALARALRRPVLLPGVPGFVLRTVMGEMGEVLLKGQRAVPARLLQSGFQFRFPEIQSALDDLLKA